MAHKATMAVLLTASLADMIRKAAMEAAMVLLHHTEAISDTASIQTAAVTVKAAT